MSKLLDLEAALLLFHASFGLVDVHHDRPALPMMVDLDERVVPACTAVPSLLRGRR